MEYSQILYTLLYGEVMYRPPRWTVIETFERLSPANATSDGWETPQTPQSHSPATNSCATDLIPRPSVPKSQVEVGWGCSIHVLS